MKLLFVGDMSASGFGTVTVDLGRALLNIGVDVRFVSQNDTGTLPEPFDARTVDLALLTGLSKRLAGGSVEMGFDGIRDFMPDIISGFAPSVKLSNDEPWGDWKPDAILLLGDFAAARMFSAPYMQSFRDTPTFHYVPIEGIDLPPSYAGLWKTLHPVAMSKFGQAEIAKVTGSVPPLAYHGVDARIFHPVSTQQPIIMRGETSTKRLTSKRDCKELFGLDPDGIFVLRTDRNMPRKGYNVLLRAMTPVLESRPNVTLGIHCRAYDQGGNLHDAMSKLPEAIRGQVSVTDMSFPRSALVALYNAADLYVSVSAEGFGLTIAEALACGVPVVGLDYSAVPEVIGPAGVCVEVGSLIDNGYDHFWAFPDEAKFGEAVADLLDHPAKRQNLGSKGPKHIARNFRWDVAAKVFRDALNGVQEPLRAEMAA